MTPVYILGAAMAAYGLGFVFGRSVGRTDHASDAWTRANQLQTENDQMRTDLVQRIRESIRSEFGTEDGALVVDITMLGDITIRVNLRAVGGVFRTACVDDESVPAENREDA